VRPATLVRLLLGSACLVAPQGVLALAGGPDRDDTLALKLARVVGARLVLQGAGDVLLGSRVRRLDIVVELAHAGSMLPVAMRWPRHRRTALVSAVVAATVAGLDFREA
jgi:hypothetical protein